MRIFTVALKLNWKRTTNTTNNSLCLDRIVKKPTKMDTIKTIRKQFAIIGIGDNDKSSCFYPINGKNSVILLLYFIDLIINGVYFVHGADSFQKYVNSTFTCSTIVVGVAICVLCIGRMPKIFEFFKNLEETIGNSEHCSSIFNWNPLLTMADQFFVPP